ncbi:MAG: efflux RND transporter periplasmic adaptor subunit [Pirellulaceae bacterium]|nr:efflux RND transporter periplasmic adaptor subunit [Pirellulaceae bacterium]
MANPATTSSGTSRPEAPSSPHRPPALGWRWWVGKAIPPALLLVAGLLFLVALGAAQRLGWIAAESAGSGATSATGGHVYTCPMHPQIRQPGAGRCPICGMELVPATSGAATDLDELSVTIQPAQRRLAHIETAAALSEPLAATIHTVGAIAIDESRMATVASYISGRLERLFADYTGVPVAKGDHLAVIYSPQLYSAQVEYLETRKALRETSNAALAAVRQAQESLAANTRQRLVELGMTEQQIVELETTSEARSRLTIHTPIGGTVIEKLAVEGKYVEAGEPIYRVADLSTVWLMLELYPEDAARIRFGQRVEAEMQSLPGERFQGRVAFIDPRVDPGTRTVGVRVEFLNPAGRLRPGDYANATIYLPIGQTGEVYDQELAGRWISPMHPQIIRDSAGSCPICGMDLVPTSRYGYAESPVEQPASLHIPRSALLMAGSNSVVYVETEPGRFEIRPVKVGPILRDKVIILDGLKAGEQVAVAGNFLIDSQMQLAGNPSLIDPARALPAQRERKEPLALDGAEAAAIAGQDGARVERLYAAYVRIQQTLAADRNPAEADASELHEVAHELTASQTLDPALGELLRPVVEHSKHLAHQDLEQARQAFKPISHAVVTLASRARGEQAKGSLVHFFCPMVPGGGGDWLQNDQELLNPYFGSRMLRCGEKAHEFPLPASLRGE